MSKEKRSVSELFKVFNTVDSNSFLEKLPIIIKQQKKFATYYGLKWQNPQEGSQNPIIPVRTLMGIEVEVEGISPEPPNIPGWSLTTDNSLRNNGREFISYPIYPQDVPGMLSLLFQTLDATIGENCWRFSWRTSLHFHLDFSHETIQTLANFLRLYALTESLFFQTGGWHRRENTYCVPIPESILMTAFRDQQIEHCSFPGVWKKYMGLNLRPLFINDHNGDSRPKGTVEFRHMEGTKNLVQIYSFINMMLSLLIAARIMTPKEIEERFYRSISKHDYLSAIVKPIFGHHISMETFAKVPFKTIQARDFQTFETSLQKLLVLSPESLPRIVSKEGRFNQMKIQKKIGTAPKKSRVAISTTVPLGEQLLHNNAFLVPPNLGTATTLISTDEGN